MIVKKTTLQKVKSILKKNIGARDNYGKLLAAYWATEVKAGDNILMMLKANKLTSTESISRARRSIQAGDATLRGKTYTHRKTVSTKETKSSLGYKTK